MKHFRYESLNKISDLDDENNGERIWHKILNLLIRGNEYTEDKKNEFEKEIKLFADLTMIHKEFQKEAGEFADIFGTYMEDNNDLSKKNAQFFTPPGLCDLLNDLTVNTNQINTNIKNAKILDCASGTGRIMLATAKKYAREKGCFDFIYFNADIDQRCWVMGTMNAILNKIPSFHFHMNSLTLEVFDCFVVIPEFMNLRWERIPVDRAKQILGIREDKE